MLHRTAPALVVSLALLVAVPRPGLPCSLCGANLRQAPSIREDATQPTARVIAIGVPRTPKDSATSVLDVTELLRNDPAAGKPKVIDLARYVPNNDVRFLVFCDIFKDKLDPFRGIPLASADAAEYARRVLKLDPKDTAANLHFYFRYLDHPDPEVARDAFIEFAKAHDQDITRAAPRLDAAKLRAWLKDPKTPPERLSVYALLLGACGRDDDAPFLRGLLNESEERVANAYDGILAGYTNLRPREGWELALEEVRDGHRPLQLRLAVVRMLRFWHGAQPEKSRDNVLRCIRAMLQQGELADLAVEDLRRWKMWDMTREVLPLYGRKGYDAPIVQRAIIRYALSCDDADCRAFLGERRKAEPDVVRDVEEEIRLEKP
jgi:hypothetical protein